MYSAPHVSIGVAQKLQRHIPNAVILGQCAHLVALTNYFAIHLFGADHNINNPLAHELTTGPEIIAAVTSTPSTTAHPSSRKVDAFVAGAGTGGTLSGVSRAIKKTHNKDAVIVAVDPVSKYIILVTQC